MADEAQMDNDTVDTVVADPVAATAPLTINITVFERGTLGPAGIEAIGSKHDILPEVFSDVWMRPTTKADAAKLAKWRDLKAKAQ